MLVENGCLFNDALSAERSVELGEGIVGYKGGDIEREWLVHIMTYRMDIAHLGCPKTDDVLADVNLSGRLVEPCEACRTRYRGGTVILHCPKVETAVLDVWLSDRFGDASQ